MKELQGLRRCLALALIIALLLPLAPVPAGVSARPQRQFISEGFTLEWSSPDVDLFTSLAWGDLDSDGYLDLAVGADCDGSAEDCYALRLYRNGAGQLPSQPDWLALKGVELSSLAWGDLDNDGDLDLAVGQRGRSAMLFLNQQGSLGDTPAWVSAETDHSRALAWGDVDGDGYIDLATAGYDGYSHLYLNQQGLLATAPAWSTPEPASAVDLDWADYDRDGDLDLALGHEAAQIQLYANEQGSLSSAPASMLGSVQGMRSMAWSDADRDGDIDLAVAQDESSIVYYYNQAGELIEGDYLSASSPTSLAWGDYNSDGLPDLLSGGAYGDTQVFQGSNHVADMPDFSFGWYSTLPDRTTAVAWADYDSDGYLDVSVSSDGYLRLYRGTPAEDPFGNEWPGEDNDNPAGMAWGDVDGDGDLDLAVGNQDGPARVYENLNGGGAPRLLWSSAESTLNASVAWGDVDGDGDLDLASGKFLYLNDAGALSALASWTAAAEGWPRRLAWGDVDGDGDLDLAAAGPAAVVYSNLGGTLESSPSWSAPEPGEAMAIAWGDVDGDGDLDLARGNDCSLVSTMICRSLLLYQNERGLLSPRAAWISAERNAVVSMAWGDVDGDGDLDLASGMLQAGARIHYNDGGRLAPAASWSSLTTQTIYDLAWADHDRDGDLDLTSAAGTDGSSFGPTVSLYDNRAGALERRAHSWITGSADRAVSLAWGDYDRDGDLDLVTPFAGTGIRYYENQRYRQSNAQLPPAIAAGRPGRTADGAGFSAAEIHAGSTLSLPYTLSHGAMAPASRVLGQYSLDGGGTWHPAVETAGPTVPLSSSVSATQVYTNVTAQPIPDRGAISSTLTLSTSGLIDSLEVLFEYDHPESSQLLITLTSPGGQQLVLSNRRSLTTLSLDPYSYNEHDVLFTNATNYSRSPYNALESYEPLEVLAGTPLAGRWTLTVVDTVAGEQGTLRSWGLRLRRNDRSRFTNATPRTIPNFTTITSTITISSSAVLHDLQLLLTIEHPNTEELSMHLTSPSGQTQQIVSGDNSSGFVDLLLDDFARYNYSNGVYGQPFTGRMQPYMPLGVFNSVALSGTWTLSISDETFGTSGQLVSWSLLPRIVQVVEHRNSTPVVIPEQGPLTSTLQLSSTATLADLQLGLHITHQNLRGLDIRLLSPEGLPLVMNFAFPGPEQPLPAQSAELTFIDGALPLFLVFGSQQLGERYGPMAKFANLLTRPISGTWQLVIANRYAEYGTGTLEAWSIREVVDAGLIQPETGVHALIPEPALLTSTIVISTSALIQDIDLTLALSHTQLSDLHISLTAPGGAEIELASGLQGADLAGTIFDDETGESIDAGSAPYVGRYRPLLGALRDLFQDPAPVNGLWTLTIEDKLHGISGALRSWSLTLTSLSGTRHVYGWDVASSGIMGQSDNALFRLLALPTLTAAPNAVAGPFLYGAASGTTQPFRLRGSQVRVLHQGQPAPDALVYRLAAGQLLDGRPLADQAGTPFRTDGQGYLQGSGLLRPGDQLLALLPISSTSAYTLYYTNGAPTPLGVDAYAVEAPGVQTIEVSDQHPLLLFNLSVSLEWDARQDTSYLQQLEANLRQASRHLYDFSDGQIALGQVQVYQNADNWAYADVAVHSTNRLRPHAIIGGVVLTPTLDPQHDELVYDIGQIHMGASWNRYGIPGQSLGSDWPLVLAHELSHYLLFQEDSYLGLSPDGLLDAVDSCPSAMGDVYQPEHSEFIADAELWATQCAGTLAAQELGRSEWDTLQLWYPWLIRPAQPNSGPALMPFSLTSVAISEPLSPVTTLEDASFTLSYAGGALSSSEGHGFLLRGSSTLTTSDDFVFDLGSPLPGQSRLQARGAVAGDRLCVFDRPLAQYGCETIELGDSQLLLAHDLSWRPLIQLTPVTSLTLGLQVGGLEPGLALAARLFPEYGPGQPAVAMVEAGEVYSATLTLPDPQAVGYLQLWLERPATETSPRPEALVSYALGGNPGYVRAGGGYVRAGGGYVRAGGGYVRAGGGYVRAGGGYVRAGGGPLVSPDGQVSFFTRSAPQPGELYALQSMPALPELPPGKLAIGQSYALLVSPGTQALSASLSFSYLSNDLLLAGASESSLRIAFWDGTSWRVLPTLLNQQHNLASAHSQGPGVYALLAGATIPLVAAVSPTLASNDLTTTLVISGGYFLAPASVVLEGEHASYSLPVVASSPLALSAVVTPGLAAGEYRVWVRNGDGATSPVPGSFALTRPADACFYDFFESGAGQWQLGGQWGLVALPGGERAITDSPGGSYANAGVQPGSATSSMTSRPFSLDNCPAPVLRLRHDYVLARLGASVDEARVELSDDGGASWDVLARYSGGRYYGADLAAGADGEEWADLAWQDAAISLRAYQGEVQLRLSLEVDAFIADRGWLIDSVVVSGGSQGNQLYLPWLIRR